jgi:hypothetical protein
MSGALLLLLFAQAPHDRPASRTPGAVIRVVCPNTGQASRRQGVQRDAQPHSPFDRGTLGIELGLAILGEAWNLNEQREWLVDGSLGVTWAFVDEVALVIEFHATRIFQQPARNAFVNGLAPLIRWQVVDGEPLSLFVEIGPGISWSDTVTPPRGTRFNYLVMAGTGLARRLGRQSHALAGFRFVHLSNAGREGRSRNPDIEALGGYAGISVVF